MKDDKMLKITSDVNAICFKVAVIQGEIKSGEIDSECADFLKSQIEDLRKLLDDLENQIEKLKEV